MFTCNFRRVRFEGAETQSDFENHLRFCAFALKKSLRIQKFLFILLILPILLS